MRFVRIDVVKTLDRSPSWHGYGDEVRGQFLRLNVWGIVLSVACMGLPEARAGSNTRAPVEIRFTEVEQGPLAAAVGYTLGATWADFDGNGRPDPFFFMLGTPGTPLFRNTSTGLVAESEPPGGPGLAQRAGGLWADIDNDGDPDLFEINSFAENDRLFRNDGGTLVAITEDPAVSSAGFGQSGAAADVDGDGWVDLFVPNGGGSVAEPNFLFLNRGGLGFERVTSGPAVEESLYSSGASFADMDSDGDMDLFVANINGAPNSLFRNDGTGRFTPVTTGGVVTGPGAAGGNASAWGDFDNDGDLDLFVTHGFPVNFLFRNQGDGTLEPVNLPPVTTLGGETVGAVWVDLDNDGWLDLVVARREGFNYVFRNTADGHFEQVVTGPIAQRRSGANGIAVADYDLDGDQDLLFDGWIFSGAPSLFRNDTAGGHWLRVRLNGTFANRSGVGARVRVEAVVNGRLLTQVRQIGGDDAFCSHELVAHFGLGDATRAARVRIEWPNGPAQELTDVAVGQVLLVTQPHIRELGPRVLNRQTGLYEQRLQFFHRAGDVETTSRVFVRGLPEGTRLIESSGREQGIPYFDLRGLKGVGPVDLLLSFHRRERTAFSSPEYFVQSGVFEPKPPFEGSRFPVDRAVVDPASGRVRVEFTAVPGFQYGIEYSDHGVVWQRAQVELLAGANRVRWIDQGLPATESHSQAGVQRSYRVIQINP
jgi:hypothetical protein